MDHLNFLLISNTPPANAHELFCQFGENNKGLKDHIKAAMILDRNGAISKEFSIFKYPSYVFLDPDLKVVTKFTQEHNVPIDPKQILEVVIKGTDFVNATTTIDDLDEYALLQIFGHLEYRDIVSVGRTCKQWHQLSQDKQLMKKIESRDFTPETWPHRNDLLVPYLCVSSTGPTFNYWFFGLYALQTGTRHGGKPVYEQMGGEYKIFYDTSNNVWTVDYRNNWKLLRAKTTTSNPTTAAWQYAYGDHNDVPLRVAAMLQLPPACSVIISCGCQSQCKFHPEVLGEYAATAQYVRGRVVYKHVDKELYLAVAEHYNRWAVLRKDEGGRWGGAQLLQSNVDPTLCPAEVAWNDDHLVVKCLIH